MIQLRIQNYTAEEIETLENVIAKALISLPCDLNEEGYCKEQNCKNFKVCNDLAKAHAFICKKMNLPF